MFLECQTCLHAVHIDRKILVVFLFFELGDALQKRIALKPGEGEVQDEEEKQNDEARAKIEMQNVFASVFPEARDVGRVHCEPPSCDARLKRRGI